MKEKESSTFNNSAMADSTKFEPEDAKTSSFGVDNDGSKKEFVAEDTEKAPSRGVGGFGHKDSALSVDEVRVDFTREHFASVIREPEL
jgi:hypothetical protein